MILVAGATGALGSDIALRLLEQGHPVRALVRATSDPATVARLRAAGAEPFQADVRDPAMLRAACEGCRTVISTVNTVSRRQPGESIESTDHQGQLNLIAEAAAAGAGHFVFVSFSGNLGSDDPLTVAKRSAERALRASGMAYTILRPSCFMEVWLSPHVGFDYHAGRARILGSGHEPVSWISQGDVAAAAVRAATDPSLRGAVLELGGPEALSPRTVVGIFEEATGRRWELEEVPEEQLRAMGEDATDSLQRSFAALMLGIARGDAIPMDTTAARLGMEFRSVRDYAREVVSAAVES